MKEKKNLTASQKLKRYRTLQYTTFGGEYLSLLTPYVIMGGVNYQEWFVQNPDAWKIGLGGSLALTLMGLATFLITKKKEGESELTGGWITLIIGWFAIAFIFILLQSIMQQIATIMMFGGIGMLGAFGLDTTSKSLKAKADAYKQALGQIKTESILDEAKKEVLAEQEQQPTE